MTFFSSFLGYQTFNKLNKSNNKKKIIFFSESKNYRNYLIGLIKSLEEEKKSNLSIIYLTSDKNDIDQISDDIKPIYIGTGFFMTLLFYLIDCDILVMTLTDLNNHKIKKSKFCKNYIYLFHSLVSVHKTYTHEAFKNYDIILCNGEYQKKELRYCEKFFNFKEKKLFNTGYLYLEHLYNNKKFKVDNNKILFAPSWNKSSRNLFDDYAEEISDILLDKNYNITLRTHPETLKRSIKNLEKIRSNEDEHYYHAGTNTIKEQIYATGGRVLNFVCLSENFFEARTKVMNSINSLNWDGGFYRKDIGYKVIDE